VIALLAIAVPCGASASPYLAVSKSGGIAGANTSLTVSSSGRARVVTSGAKTRRFRLSVKRLHALKRDVKKADFPHLKASYGPQNCSDAFVYDLAHGGRDVSVIYCQPKLPSGLAALLADVGDLLG
jgi:hypothetical protein